MGLREKKPETINTSLAGSSSFARQQPSAFQCRLGREGLPAAGPDGVLDLLGKKGGSALLEGSPKGRRGKRSSIAR